MRCCDRPFSRVDVGDDQLGAGVAQAMGELLAHVAQARDHDGAAGDVGSAECRHGRRAHRRLDTERRKRARVACAAKLGRHPCHMTGSA
jgi:hypothetical protein